MFKKQGTSKRSASTSIGDINPGFHEATPTDMGSQASACDMAWASEELLELDEVQLATVVGGVIPRDEVLPKLPIPGWLRKSLGKGHILNWDD